MSPTVDAATAAALQFTQVSTYDDHTCGLTTAGLAYCWGDNQFGELGDGGGSPREETPVAVAGGHQFIQVTAGSVLSCGVATDHRAWCWGGIVGDGTTSQRPTPVQVGGALQFYQMVAGEFHTCGVTYPDRRAFCWGDNQFGQLGDGTITERLAPVLVTGGLRFREVTLGRFHTCAVTTSDVAYCWGWDQNGQLGDGSSLITRHQPVRVKTDLAFRQIDAGPDHTCAVSTAHRAYCWGLGKFGRIGDGQTNRRYVPKAVAGGLTVDRVSAGGEHTCAETSSNVAYCWGYNSLGELGDGTTTQRLTPVPVSGGLHFSQLSAGAFYTCGRTPAGAAYCWGDNSFGQLGNGGTSSTANATPSLVVGPS